MSQTGFITGWLQKFKVCHGITCLIVSGESRDAPVDSVTEWLKVLPGIISEYQPKGIFNGDKVALFYHLMLNLT